MNVISGPDPSSLTRHRAVWMPFARVLTVLFCGVQPLPAFAGGEPAQDFLKQLRAAGYFDSAEAYLNRLDQYPGVPRELMAAVDLERAQTFIEAASATRNVKVRDEMFEKAESSLRGFLATESTDRETEARLRLGKLQMIRAASLAGGEAADQKNQQARTSYLEAASTFEQVVESLREKLLQMRGAKIDVVNNPQQAAVRDRFKAEFLESMMRSGQAYRLAALTHDDPAKQAKPLLEKSLEKFYDLSESYDGYVQGAMALLSRGLVQEALGQSDAAVDSFTRMVESVDAPELFESKVQATSGLIRMALAKDPPQYLQAINRGAPMLEDIRADQRQTPMVAELQTQLARAYLEKANDKENQKPAEIRRAKSETRTLLLAASKVAGPHSRQTTELLASIGIEKDDAATPVQIAEAKTFEEALQKSQQLYQVSEQLSQSIGVLPADSDQQKSELWQQLEQSRSAAIETLRSGLTMIRAESDVTLVNQARQLLSYLLYQEKRYRESSAVGQFLAKNAPSTDLGLRGGLLALNSMQSLLRDNPDAPGLIKQVESLGTYLASTWPGDAQASAAKSVLVGLALEAKDWQRARELIGDLPDGPSKSQSRVLLGQFLWGEAIGKLRDDQSDAANALMKQARDDLQLGLQSVRPEDVDAGTMRAGLVLTKILLRLDQADQAADVLADSVYGPTVLFSKYGDGTPSFASDLYSTQLQVSVSRMSRQGVDVDQALGQAAETMDRLRQSVSGKDADKKLTSIYLRLARSIREQLDAALPAKKAKLTEAFRVFLEQVSKSSSQPATLRWVGQTLMELGQSLLPTGQIKASGQAAVLLETAVQTFGRLPQDQQATAVTLFQVGRAHRLLGNYGDAIGSFERLLKDKPTMIDAQVESALSYQQWAQTLPPKFASKSYAKAISGAKPDQGKNVIWGWGRISQLTSRSPDNRDTFFTARYNLALSRYLWGKSESRQELIKAASADITKVAALYPEMGGPTQRKEFDTLLRKIQLDLGQTPTGLTL